MTVSGLGFPEQVGRGIAAFGDIDQGLAEGAELGGGFGGLLFPDDPLHLQVAGFAKLFLAEGRGPGQ